jgi:GTP-binding protein
MFKIITSEYLASFTTLKSLPSNGLPEIAFAGRSNVGKSSLINILLGRRRLAQTSSTPGKTRMLNFFSVNGAFYFVDLPGYGYAKVSKEMRKQWQTLVEPYLQNRESLRGVVQLMDLRHEPTRSDRELLEWLDFHDIPVLAVLTKADKLSRGRAHAALLEARKILGRKEGQCLSFSILTAEGRDLIWRWIRERIGI